MATWGTVIGTALGIAWCVIGTVGAFHAEQDPVVCVWVAEGHHRKPSWTYHHRRAGVHARDGKYVVSGTHAVTNIGRRPIDADDEPLSGLDYATAAVRAGVPDGAGLHAGPKAAEPKEVMIREPRKSCATCAACVVGPPARFSDPVSPGVWVLYALFLNERYNAQNPVPRLEPSYCPGGRYYSDRLWKLYGEDSAKSYSNWQLMFATAHELGYRGMPHELDDDTVAVRWVVEVLNRRVIRKARSNDQVVTLEERWLQHREPDRRVPEL
jgi:hypothetical protein